RRAWFWTRADRRVRDLAEQTLGAGTPPPRVSPEAVDDRSSERAGVARLRVLARRGPDGRALSTDARPDGQSQASPARRLDRLLEHAWPARVSLPGRRARRRRSDPPPREPPLPTVPRGLPERAADREHLVHPGCGATRGGRAPRGRHRGSGRRAVVVDVSQGVSARGAGSAGPARATERRSDGPTRVLRFHRRTPRHPGDRPRSRPPRRGA